MITPVQAALDHLGKVTTRLATWCALRSPQPCFFAQSNEVVVNPTPWMCLPWHLCMSKWYHKLLSPTPLLIPLAPPSFTRLGTFVQVNINGTCSLTMKSRYQNYHFMVECPTIRPTFIKTAMVIITESLAYTTTVIPEDLMFYKEARDFTGLLPHSSGPPHSSASRDANQNLAPETMMKPEILTLLSSPSIRIKLRFQPWRQGGPSSSSCQLRNPTPTSYEDFADRYRHCLNIPDIDKSKY